MTNVSNDFKTCTRCKIEKSVNDFAISRREKTGRAYWCKACMNEIGAKSRKLSTRTWPIPVINENETWKDVPGFEGLYKISTSGRVISYPREWVTGGKGVIKRSKPECEMHQTKGEYFTVCLTKNRHERPYGIHRLLALAFIPNPENKREVNHKDGNKHNNAIDNLEWATSSENRQHAFDTGLKKMAHSENSHRAKFTNDQVREMRASTLSIKELSEMYSAPYRTVLAIVRKVSYKYVQ